MRPVTTIGVSCWRADCGKHMALRMSHLLEKRGVAEWVWVVRATNDVTSRLLVAAAESAPVPVSVIEEDHDAPDDRILRVSLPADIGLNAAIMRGADRVLYHESDLISPEDIALRLGDVLDTPPRAVVGGWPCLASDGMAESQMLFEGAARLGRELTISIDGKPQPLPFFYDSWGYRYEGQRFGSVPPHSPCYRADEPFCLDSVGSVALIDAVYLRSGARMEGGGFVRLCEQIRLLGGEIWCDPRVTITQPLELWTFENN